MWDGELKNPVQEGKEAMEQGDFLRQMKELVEFGRAKENILTKEEIQDYCDDMFLTEEQLELVYAFLLEHHIRIPGCKRTSADGAEEKEAAYGRTADSKYLRIYRKELRELREYTEDETARLYERLKNGEEQAIHQVVESHLGRVLTLAGRYRGRGVLLEDLIQEGNLELTACATMLCGNREAGNIEQIIDDAVKARLMEMVDEELAGLDSDNLVLARVNLLLEATRTLAEEYGRIATVEELSEFTHMDREEIDMYVELSRGKIEVGKRE